MGRTEHRRVGFTLIELLIVIVIISLLAALLLPALMKALCTARQGTAASLISQLAQASKAYELDFAVFPPGKGTDSKDLAFYLQKKGAKQMQYFEFNPEMLDQGNIVNPVWGRDGEPPMTWIYYRNNQMAGKGEARRGRGAGGPDPASQQLRHVVRRLRLPRRTASAGRGLERQVRIGLPPRTRLRGNCRGSDESQEGLHAG
jgi:prepilin-type N-terminal cleavage/methylation domain-containing protein